MWGNQPFESHSEPATEVDVLKAIEFAMWAHALKPIPSQANPDAGGMQTRFCHKTNRLVPYSVHPVRVVALLAEYGENYTVQMAGACHDLLEDTTVKLDELINVIGREATELVMWVTDAEFKGSRENRSWLKHQRIRNAPPEAKVIKLADMVNNTESLGPKMAKFWNHTRRAEMIDLGEICRESNERLWAYLENTAISQADQRMPPKEEKQ